MSHRATIAEMRDDFPESVKRSLAARVGHTCSRPECGAATSGPQSDSVGTLNVGVAAHITAASTEGPRYLATLTADQRSSVENGIWLCQNCAKLVDNDEQRFSPELLREWKSAAELRAIERIGKTADASDEIRDARSRLRAAFADALADLRSDQVDASYVISKARKAHDRALIDFRTYVLPERVEQYDEIVEHFKSVREHAQPAMLSFYESQATGKASGSTPGQITAAVERIFAFARS